MLLFKLEAINLKEAMLTITMRHSRAITFYSTPHNSTNMSPQHHLYTIPDQSTLIQRLHAILNCMDLLHVHAQNVTASPTCVQRKLRQYTYMGSQNKPNHSRRRRRTSP